MDTKETLKSSVKKLLEEKDYSENVKGILKLILDDKMYRSNVKIIFDSTANKEGLKKELANVILDHIGVCLEDGLITKEELTMVKMLRLFFGIEEGDSFELELKPRIEQLLTIELEKMYDDKIINNEEALTKVELQELFGLCYEDFYEIDKKVAQKAIKNGAEMKNLGSFFDL